MNIEKFMKEDMGIRVKVGENNVFELNAKDIADVLGIKSTVGSSVDYYKFFMRVSSVNHKLYGKKILFERVSENGTYESALNELYVKESIFYNLVLSSKSSKSIPFQLWVCEEVLPSIRKNNYYVNEEHITKEQYERLKDTLLIFCENGKIGLPNASEKIFGDKKELNKRLMLAGKINREICWYDKDWVCKDGEKEYPIFVCDMKGKYKEGEVSNTLQVSLTNHGFVFLREFFHKNPNAGLEKGKLF